jgi:hypothetical protein
MKALLAETGFPVGGTCRHGWPAFANETCPHGAARVPGHLASVGLVFTVANREAD